MLSIGILTAIAHAKHPNDAILDGGATGTVVGIHEYHDICEELNLEPRINAITDHDPTWHAFGVKGNSSTSEEVVGTATVPDPCG